MDYQLWLLIIFITLLVYVFIRTLKYLTPLALVANVGITISMVIIFQYIVRDLPPASHYPAFNSWKNIALVLWNSGVCSRMHRFGKDYFFKKKELLSCFCSFFRLIFPSPCSYCHPRTLLSIRCLYRWYVFLFHPVYLAAASSRKSHEIPERLPGLEWCTQHGNHHCNSAICSSGFLWLLEVWE